MSQPWFLLEAGGCDPAINMAADEALLLAVARLARPILRFYGWTEPAATFGYFQKHAEIARWTQLRPLIRRPTGGGLVPHLSDWTYCIAVPPGNSWYELSAEESYRTVHEWIRLAFARLNLETSLAPEAHHDVLGQCFIGAEKHDLLWHGRKIAGAAQRRNRHGLLIQGSVQQQPPGAERKAWETAMREVGTTFLDATWETWKPTPSWLAEVESLAAQKYRQASFNEKR
jgi:lipoate-protein ligase A